MNTRHQTRTLDRLPSADAYAHRQSSVPGSALRWITGTISRLRWRRSTMQVLDILNDHQLKDIGLERSDITPSAWPTSAPGYGRP